MKKVQLGPKMSTSLTEGSLGKAPKLPPTTPSPGPQGRASPYSTLLEAHYHAADTRTMPTSSNVTPPNTALHALYKMIAKLPFEVRERVTSIVNMAIFTSENTLKQYEGLRIELMTLKTQHKKKETEYDQLNQRCDIFREQITMLQEKLGALQDDADSRQNYAIRNSKAISRLSSTNKTLIDAFALVTDGNNKQKANNRGRRKQILPDTAPILRLSSPDIDKNPSPTRSTGSNTPKRTQAVKSGPAHSDLEVSVTKNEKLRERLLRVAKDHNRVVKNIENLESKIQGYRSSLRYAERRNRQLQLELDELRESQSLESSTLEKKNQPDDPSSDRRGNSGLTRKPKERMHTRLSALVNRNAFDPMEGIKHMDGMIAHLSATPSNLVEADTAHYLCSRAACGLFDVERMAVYILQPGGLVMHRYMTSSSRVESIRIGVQESLAENVLRHGLIRRYNNLKQVKNIFFDTTIDAADDASLKRILSVPVRELGCGRVIGCIHFLNKRDNKFSEVDELYASAYGEMCGGFVSGALLFRRVWHESAIISGVIQAPLRLNDALPEKESLSALNPLLVQDILYTIENVVRDALKCSKAKAFVVSEKAGMNDETFLVSLQQEAITMMTLKSSCLTTKSTPRHSGVAGHVVQSKQPYLVRNPSFDPWLNPEVDLNSPDDPFYCIPIINFTNDVVACIQISPSPLSPEITATQEQIDPFALSFERAADWLAYSLSANITNILSYVGRPSARPDITLAPITLTEKLATTPLSLNPAKEVPHKKRPTLAKSVSLIEDGHAFHGGSGVHQKANRADDMKEFLLQFPSFDEDPKAAPSAAIAAPAETKDSELDKVKTEKEKLEKFIQQLKAELIMVKDSARSERNSLKSEITSLKEATKAKEKNDLREQERQMESTLLEYRTQFDQDLIQMRSKHEEETLLFRRNIESLQEDIKSLHSKLAFVDKPINHKNIDMVGFLEVSALVLTYSEGVIVSPSEAFVEIKLGDGSNWSYLTSLAKPVGSVLNWKNLALSAKVSQAQVTVDTLSIRIKEKSASGDKLTGVTSFSIDSLLSRRNQWVEIPCELLDRGGAIPQGRVVVRLLYRHEMEDAPVETVQDQRLEPAPPMIEDESPICFLDICEVKCVGNKILGQSNIYAELSFDAEWVHMTDIKSSSSSNEIIWRSLPWIGRVHEKSLMSTPLTFHIKLQNGLSESLFGKANIPMSSLLNRRGEWVFLTQPLLDQMGQNEIGASIIRVRCRYEGEEYTGVAEQSSLKADLPKEVTETIVSSPPKSLVLHEDLPASKEKDVMRATSREEPAEISEEEPREIILEGNFEQEGGEGMDAGDEEADYQPPPTPSRQEIENTSRGSSLMGVWVEMISNGSIYYYNTLTGQSVWDRPDDFDGTIPEDDLLGDLPGQDDTPVTQGDWTQLQDDGGNYYWYNEVTGQSAWELPSSEPDEVYSMPPSIAAPSTYASASAGGYTIEL